jgi:hypothetical protein
MCHQSMVTDVSARILFACILSYYQHVIALMVVCSLLHVVVFYHDFWSLWII